MGSQPSIERSIAESSLNEIPLSQSSAQVVSKGGAIPDMLRNNHVRRDNYLSNLLSSRVSERTNLVNKYKPQIPRYIKINDKTFHEAQPFNESTGLVTVASIRGGHASVGSSNGNRGTSERIQLNLMDLRLIKNSIKEESRRLGSDDGGKNGRERLNSLGQVGESVEMSSVAPLTHYVARQPSEG